MLDVSWIFGWSSLELRCDCRETPPLTGKRNRTEGVDLSLGVQSLEVREDLHRGQAQHKSRFL